jgi:phage-related baseplate assembly protein
LDQVVGGEGHEGRWVGLVPATAQGDAEAGAEVSAQVNDDALRPLVDMLADAIAPRVADEVSRLLTLEPEQREPWRLLTLEEAAARLGRSTRWTRERKERIGYVRLDGGALAFELEDLRGFARARRVGA